MNPIEMLKQEHVVIVRMTEDIGRKIRRFREEERVDSRYVDTAADFIRTYADLCHHGKEEGILFEALAAKDLEPRLAALMRELTQEHEWARSATRRLVEANDAYFGGDTDVLEQELRILEQIRRFYPGHVTKEESRFFNPCMKYFSEGEIEDLGAQFVAFDQNVIHEKYRRLVERLEEASSGD